MTLDGFLTFLGLAAAIYALVPSVAKLRAKLGLRLHLLVASCALILVLYLEFFDLVGQECPTTLGRACEWFYFPADKSFTPPQLAFFVVLAWMGAAWLIHRYSRPGASLLPSLSRLVDGLVYERRFAEVLKLVEPYLPLIDRAMHRSLFFQRLHYWLLNRAGLNVIDPKHFPKGLEEPKIKSSLPERTMSFAKRQLGNLAVLIPSQRKAEEAAREIARVLLRSVELRRFIVQMRPYSALTLLKLRSFDKHDFATGYFQGLLADPASILYHELRHNQNVSYGGCYSLPETNRLLHYLFTDINTAIDLSVWKPIGDYVLANMRPDHPSKYFAQLNGRSDNFDDEQWHDPTFAGIFFFDIMVRAAAYQGIEYHMWLFYIPLIVRELEEGYDTSSPRIDLSDEFPTRSARLIYEALRTVRDWVELVEHLPEESTNRVIPDAYTARGDTIPDRKSVV